MLLVLIVAVSPIMTVYAAAQFPTCSTGVAGLHCSPDSNESIGLGRIWKIKADAHPGEGHANNE